MSNDFCMDIDRDCAHIVTMRKQLEMSDAALTEATESIVQMREQIATLTRQRDLAVEALEKWDMFFGGDAETAVLTIAEDPSTLTGCQKATKEAMSAIKESEAMAQVCEGGVR